MKIFSSFTFFCLFMCSFAYSQKVDIDNYRIYISNAKFPWNYVPAENRTFMVKVTGEWNNKDIENQIFIPGWDLVPENPSLEVMVTIDRMYQGVATSKTRVDEKKDKDGKVTSSTKYYSVYSTNQGNGNLVALGVKNEMPKTPSKKDIEKQAKKDKEKKEKENANPFLKNVDVVVDDVLVDNKSNKKLAYNYDLGQSFTYTTSESTSSYTATREWETNSNSQFQNHKNQYVKHVINLTNSLLAERYAYVPYRNWVKFQELDSPKHPEYEMYKNATQALKAIFEKMRYNKPVLEIEQDLTPIIKYFDDVENRYTKDDKHEKRLRAATLYNLVKIFQYLDRHDKAIEIANKMISLDLEKGDAEDLVDESTKIKKMLDFHKMTTRHIVPRTDAEKEDNLGESEEQEGKP